VTRGSVSAVALATLALAGCGAEPAQRPATNAAPATTVSTMPQVNAPTAAPHGDEAARPRRRVALRAAPAGRVAARVGSRTTFGSPRWMPIVRRRGAWLGVIATERPNGRLGWLRAGDVEVRRVEVRLAVDLSRRALRVVRDGRTVLRMPVAVGAPGTPTPTGRFAVTDGLRTQGASPYGCCILALSGHQPNVPQGWTGGDRIAVHGTTAPASIGRAASHGCLRARDRDLRRLMRAARLGAIVEIRT
jgi:hypothetical protein